MTYFRQYREITKGEFFVIAGDTAMGGNDYCAAQFLSTKRLDVPLVYHRKGVMSYMTEDLLTVLERLHDVTGIKPVIAYERNNGGAIELERLAGLNKRHKFEVYKMDSYGIDYSSRKEGEPEAVKYGWDTNTATRPKMLSDLKEAIDKVLVKIYDKPTITELYSFIVAQTSSTWKAQAEKGAHDDLVMSLAIAWQLYQVCRPPVTQEEMSVLASQFPSEELFDESGFY